MFLPVVFSVDSKDTIIIDINEDNNTYHQL